MQAEQITPIPFVKAERVAGDKTAEWCPVCTPVGIDQVPKVSSKFLSEVKLGEARKAK